MAVECDWRASPQRAQAPSPRAGNSPQHGKQIGIKESRGRGEPQRAQEEGRRMQLKLSKGLRSTRTTARHQMVSDGGTMVVLAPLTLWKTHLASGRSSKMLPVAPSIAQDEFSAPAQRSHSPSPRSEKGNQPHERQRAAAKSRSIPRCPLFRLSGYGRHLRLSAEGVGNANPAPQSVWVS